MIAVQGGTAPSRRQGRRWHFASAVFDEASWTLSVDGKRVALEHKPMELLHELILRAGAVVSKDELLDAVWPDVTVVEASLPTAVLKLRRALGDDARDDPIIQTVPRIGYRLGVPIGIVSCDALQDAEPEPREWHNHAANSFRGPQTFSRRSWSLIAGGSAFCLIAGAIGTAYALRAPATISPLPIGQWDAATAIRKLDVDKIEAMMRAGWSPNTPFDKEGDAALNILMGVCEWNPDHDRKAMLLMARTMLEGGAKLDGRNSFGDTPYSIAKAERYCGPDHPVTKMLYTLCYKSGNPLGDKCLATYELARARRK